jgi:hypothetical protein
MLGSRLRDLCGGMCYWHILFHRAEKSYPFIMVDRSSRTHRILGSGFHALVYVRLRWQEDADGG